MHERDVVPDCPLIRSSPFITSSYSDVLKSQAHVLANCAVVIRLNSVPKKGAVFAVYYMYCCYFTWFSLTILSLSCAPESCSRRQSLPMQQCFVTLLFKNLPVWPWESGACGGHMSSAGDETNHGCGRMWKWYMERKSSSGKARGTL